MLYWLFLGEMLLKISLGGVMEPHRGENMILEKFSLLGKVALVTGARTGIGQGIARPHPEREHLKHHNPVRGSRQGISIGNARISAEYTA
ncbi:MAG: hypothetical protein CSA35_01385 [Dethiosulfovibrio peptidovorans]|nr:MAG: hypothetical protein CSA35_01385 [Dethiosulfovibrio peptidovorans]